MKLLMGGDFHFRAKAPEARLDDYLTTQDNLIKWLKGFEDTHIILNSGDIVHNARERSDALGFANYLMKNLPKMYGVPGNHDLLYHSLDTDTIDKTTLGVLINAGKFVPIQNMTFDNVSIYGYPYGSEIEHITKNKNKDHVHIAVYHGMVLQEPDPFIEGKIAIDLLKEFPEYDIILTGDNHKGFMIEYEDRVLLNPGSLKRDNADQIEHVPYLYSFDPATLKLERVKVPTEDDIISREHLEIEKQRDQRIEQLSEKFKEVENATLDFDENMYEFLHTNDVRKGVDLKIMQWMTKEVGA